MLIVMLIAMSWYIKSAQADFRMPGLGDGLMQNKERLLEWPPMLKWIKWSKRKVE